MLRVKRSEFPSATQRMYEPAKQSACCSATSVGVPLFVQPGLVLDRVAVLVGKNIGDGDLAEVVLHIG